MATESKQHFLSKIVKLGRLTKLLSKELKLKIKNEV